MFMKFKRVALYYLIHATIHSHVRKLLDKQSFGADIMASQKNIFMVEIHFISSITKLLSKNENLL